MLDSFICGYQEMSITATCKILFNKINIDDDDDDDSNATTREGELFPSRYFFNSIEFYSSVQFISLRSPLKSSLSFVAYCFTLRTRTNNDVCTCPFISEYVAELDRLYRYFSLNCITS